MTFESVQRSLKSAILYERVKATFDDGQQMRKIAFLRELYIKKNGSAIHIYLP